MISLVLECPECSSRFRFENESDQFPEKIGCPQCGSSKEYWTFMAVLFCSQCNTKLKAPLSIIDSTALGCPRCNAPLDCNYNTASSEEKIENENRSQMMLGGEIFDKYRIIRLLGKGGMAEVYLAEHLLLKQLCALKIMLDTTAAKDPVYVKRFLREAKLSHKLNHPNIVKMHEVGSDTKTGYFFIAMEYVEGETLTEIMHTQKLSEEYLKILLHSMAGALKCLADAGVVHRDIKPSNIMLDKNGIFKLMDLGIAKTDSNRMAGEMTLTMEQTAIGTPSYASPEQCRSSHNVDTRSDIYSLGATLYHAASGKLPFDGATPVEIILKVIQSSPESLSSLRPDLSDNFIALVEMMMKKSPEERPSSPEELTALLPLSGKAPEIKMKKISRQKNKEKSSSTAFSKVLKYGFVLLLLLVIVINVRYIYDYYNNDPARKNEPPKRVFSSSAVPRETPKRAILPTTPKKKDTDIQSIIYSPVKPAEKTAKSKTPAAKPVIPLPQTPAVQKSNAEENKAPKHNTPVKREIPSPNSGNRVSGPLSWTKEIPELELCKTPNPYTKNENIDEQLQNSDIRYREFHKETSKLINDQQKKLATLSYRQRKLYQELLQYRQDLDRQWKAHLDFLASRNKKIHAARNRRYDKRANEKVQQAFLEQTKKRSDWGYNSEDINFSRKLQEMLKNPAVDPNIAVVDSHYKEFSGSLLFSITSGRIREADKIIKILSERGADPFVPANNRSHIVDFLPLIPHYGSVPKRRVQEAFDYMFNHDYSNREKYIRLLFIDGAKVHADHLSTAVLEKNKTLVMLLLATGLDPNERDSNGETALFKTYRLESNGEEIRELLLAAGADPSIKNKNSRVAADYAVLEKFFKYWFLQNYRECETMLKEGFNPDIRLSNGQPLLFWAADKLNETAMKMVLKYGADPNRPDRNQQVPLRIAMSALFRESSRRKNNIDDKIRIVKDLINAGASPAKTNNRAYHFTTILRYLIQVYDMTESKMIPELATLIIKNEKDMTENDWYHVLNSCSYGGRKNGHEKIAKAIMEIIPEDFIYSSNSSSYLLSRAFIFGFPLKVEKLEDTLIPRMITSRYFVQSKGEHYPLLFLAVEHEQSPEVIELLLKKGADPNWKNRNGLNALNVAKSNKVRRILRKYMK